MKTQYCSNCSRYYGGSHFKRLENYKCLYCDKTIVDLNIEEDEFEILWNVSQDNDFLQQMIELKEKDSIEFQLKMQQFKTQTAQQKQLKQQESSKPKCPKCKSTSITTGARGVNFTWGLIGASKTVNRCANCGHTWKP